MGGMPDISKSDLFGFLNNQHLLTLHVGRPTAPIGVTMYHSPNAYDKELIARIPMFY